MRRVALRTIRSHPVRFVLSVLAVTLGVAFVAGTFSLRTMLASTFNDIVESSLAGDAYVRGSAAAGSASATGGQVGDARNAIPIALADDVADVPGVELALPDIVGPAVLVGADGAAVTRGQAPSFAQALYPDDPTVRVDAGRAPAGSDEIALAAQTLAQSGLALGERTTAVIGGAVRTVTVVGRVDFGAPLAGATVLFLDVPTATAAYAANGMVQSIAVYAADDVTPAALVDRLDPVVGSRAEAVTGDLLRAEVRADIDAALGFVATFLLVFAGISLFVGAFIIANTFAMSVRQRMRELALLRALGASPLQVFASIVVQAGVVGLVGSALGVVAGLALVSGLREVLDRFGMVLSGRIPLDPRTVAFSLLIGTLVSLCAGALPARRAALTPPVQAMRDDVVGDERGLRVRALVGGLLTVAGAAAVAVAVARPGLDAELIGAGPLGAVRVDAPALLGVGAAAVVLGMLGLAPAIARAALGVLAVGFVLAFRPIGRFARQNVTRNPRRTATTAGALMIGMALVGASGVLAASAQGSTRAIVAETSTADFVLRSATGALPADALPAIAGVPGVAAADAVTLGSVLIARAGAAGSGAAGSGDRTPTTVVGLDPGAFGRTMEIETTAGSLTRLAAGEVAVQRGAAQDAGWELGTSLALTSATRSTTATVGAIIDSPAIPAPVVLPEPLFERLVPATGRQVTLVFVAAAAGTDRAGLRADLTRAVVPFVVVAVLDNDEFASVLAEQVDQVLVILYALLALSVVIAILGIVNTLALSVIERTREIGLMRAVGLGRLQLAGTVTIESVLTALFGTVVGVAVGIALAAAMPAVFSDVGLTTLVIPWATVGWTLVLAVVAGVLAAGWPAVRAARLRVLDAVSVD
ncbi:ABC transporter permease [Pengzhenrongella sicca]|uniref:FtsX-like permease family protein n=1 Tax=Pengzhenrongella sicca TaxID=2819238 RepID=A0A8A4ZJJ6_9MICO|nr:FtsX-like permease family protein [Pengzhenrongella sicca]QTE29768.1 FtsX-like permease family protein [Pengzhenrongella sicca]